MSRRPQPTSGEFSEMLTDLRSLAHEAYALQRGALALVDAQAERAVRTVDYDDTLEYAVQGMARFIKLIVNQSDEVAEHSQAVSLVAQEGSP